jgi:hypothetical protein
LTKAYEFDSNIRTLPEASFKPTKLSLAPVGYICFGGLGDFVVEVLAE